jgi:hypothetical protein
MHRLSSACLFLIVALVATSSTAYAGSIAFSSAGPGAEGAELSASTLFEVSGNTLKTTLLNTGDSSGSTTDLSANNLSDPSRPQTGNPLIEGDVVFTMLIAGGSLLESQISNVSFEYGTSFSEPKLPAGMSAPASIPEPTMLLLLAPAMGFALRRRLRARTVHGRKWRA